MKLRKYIRANSLTESFFYAFKGIVTAFKNERNLRFHFLAALLVIILSFVLKLSKIELAIITLTIVAVISAELFNTAIESIVNLLTISRHPMAKIAKDVAAGAVLVISIGALVIAYLIFFDRIILFWQH